MPTSKVTRKGQITIPQEIREALGIREGDVVEVMLSGDRAEVWRVPAWSELAGSLGDRARAVVDAPSARVAGEAAWVSEAAGRLHISSRDDPPGRRGTLERRGTPGRRGAPERE